MDGQISLSFGQSIFIVLIAMLLWSLWLDDLFLHCIDGINASVSYTMFIGSPFMYFTSLFIIEC